MRPMISSGLAVVALAGVVAWPVMATAEPTHDHVVTMNNMSYGKIPTDLKVGDTIAWVNHDTVPHTVTARDKSFDLRMGPGQTVRQTLQKDGSFAFYCIYHAMMRGTLKVAAK